MSKYRCPNCGSRKLESRGYDYGNEIDGIEQYYEYFLCKDCVTDITMLNGEVDDYYTIEQAEEDKWN